MRVETVVCVHTGTVIHVIQVASYYFLIKKEPICACWKHKIELIQYIVTTMSSLKVKDTTKEPFSVTAQQIQVKSIYLDHFYI